METKNINNAQIFILPTSRRVEKVNVQDIIRIQSLSNYSKLFFYKGRTLVMAKVVHWFEEQLLYYHYIRSHRSHLVNEYYIQRFVKKFPEKLILFIAEVISIVTGISLCEKSGTFTMLSKLYGKK